MAITQFIHLSKVLHSTEILNKTNRVYGKNRLDGPVIQLCKALQLESGRIEPAELIELRAKCIKVGEDHVINTFEMEQMGLPEAKGIVYGTEFL